MIERSNCNPLKAQGLIDPSQLDARDAALQKLLLESNLIKDQSELNKIFANEHAKDSIYEFVNTKARLRFSGSHWLN